MSDLKKIIFSQINFQKLKEAQLIKNIGWEIFPKN